MSTTTSSPFASFTVGNTYARIPSQEANFDRSGKFRKVHDWLLYVDVWNGADVIEKVEFCFDSTFSPRVFTCHSPIPVGTSDAGKWRFSTRQQTFAMGIICTIKVHVLGGTIDTLKYTIKPAANTNGIVRNIHPSDGAKLRLGPVPFSETQTFGIELELTSARRDGPDQVASSLSQYANTDVDVMVDDYAGARASYNSWKLVQDSSIACHIHRPDCNAFELVSPILQGRRGLNECQAVMKGLKKLSRSVRVNKSMGFHVHVNVENASLSQLIKICQNFIKYEQVMDSIMPPSRRQNEFCRSNKESVPGQTNLMKHAYLAQCQTLAELVDAMQGDSRYFKLNLMNLKTGRQPTIEFRQHSATLSQEKVLNWIRCCTSLVSNSIRLRGPSSMRASKSIEEQTKMMFAYAVKDRYLKQFYAKRQEEVKNGPPCCDACASGNKRKSMA